MLKFTLRTCSHIIFKKSKVRERCRPIEHEIKTEYLPEKNKLDETVMNGSGKCRCWLGSQSILCKKNRLYFVVHANEQSSRSRKKRSLTTCSHKQMSNGIRRAGQLEDEPRSKRENLRYCTLGLVPSGSHRLFRKFSASFHPLPTAPHRLPLKPTRTSTKRKMETTRQRLENISTAGIGVH